MIMETMENEEQNVKLRWKSTKKIWKKLLTKETIETSSQKYIM